ncbi:hypothetical protein KIN20_038318 [Parelaphostrongylus tenuis]|uniref:Uncharacterized protein n=1 Tax=Parelaphostrongylus tenuis TaxID=148309 RepID=A0AAD5WMH0_PARTN|nr:hypothetical protein KIN20_038318 [Parelaphostrongylus tenuis]
MSEETEKCEEKSLLLVTDRFRFIKSTTTQCLPSNEALTSSESFIEHVKMSEETE